MKIKASVPVVQWIERGFPKPSKKRWKPYRISHAASCCLASNGGIWHQTAAYPSTICQQNPCCIALIFQGSEPIRRQRSEFVQRINVRLRLGHIKPCFRSWPIKASSLVFDRLLHGKPAFLFGRIRPTCPRSSP